MSVCSVCHGQKGSIVLACPGARQIVIPCEPCTGTGEMTGEQVANVAQWKRQGNELRATRIALRISMRDAAAEHGMGAPRYSRIEFGMEPAPWLAEAAV